MKPIITSTIVFVLSLTFTLAQGILENDITGNNPNTYNPYMVNQVLDSNVSSTGIGRGSGIVGKNKNDQYRAKRWNSSTFDENDYFEFTMTPDTGYQIDFINFIYTPKKNNGSVDNFELRSSIDDFTSTIVNPSYIESGVTIDLSSAVFQGIQGTITFRLYAWGADNGSKHFSIKNFAFNGNVSQSYTLSIGNQDIANKSLSIIEHQNGEVQFKLTGALAMKSIQIIDLMGRSLYNLNVSGDSIALDLNISRRTIYIAIVQLSNGQVITKKAVKRY